MVFGLVLPMIVAVVAASGAAWVQRRLRPDWATWTLTVLSVGAALAVLWALTVLAAGYAAEQPRLAGAIGWCHVLFTSHDRVPAPLGIGAWAALAASAVSVRARVRARRATLRMTHDDVARSSAPMAYAVPGRPGRVIVSEGMLITLVAPLSREFAFVSDACCTHTSTRTCDATTTASGKWPISLPPQYRFCRRSTARFGLRPSDGQTRTP
mgnify:CR=1 FL=1